MGDEIVGIHDISLTRAHRLRRTLDSQGGMFINTEDIPFILVHLENLRKAKAGHSGRAWRSRRLAQPRSEHKAELVAEGLNPSLVVDFSNKADLFTFLNAYRQGNVQGGDALIEAQGVVSNPQMCLPQVPGCPDQRLGENIRSRHLIRIRCALVYRLGIPSRGSLPPSCP